MKIQSGIIMFDPKSGEAGEIQEILEGTPEEDNIPARLDLLPHCAFTTPQDARIIVEALAGLIDSSSSQPETLKDRAAEKLMEIALAGLRGSGEEGSVPAPELADQPRFADQANWI